MSNVEFNQQVRSILYKDKEYVDDRISSGIEQYRKGFAKIKFVDSKGNSVKNVRVKARLNKHHFDFGANIFMLDELETEEKNRKYKEYFKDLYNMATLPFYWKDLEPIEGAPRYKKDSPRVYRRPTPDLCLEWCEQNGIKPKEHCLNYDQWSPDWLDRENVPLIKKKLEKRFKELSELYSDKIIPWEVTNETFFHNNLTSFYLSDDYVEWSFDTANKYFPYNELIINEANDAAWGGNEFNGNRTPYYMQIERLLNSGRRIDTIGMQYHIFWKREEVLKHLKYAYDMKRFYAVLDKYSEFGKPMQITEITIPAYTLDSADEELQAEILTRLYKVWFSHEKMEAIIYWNLVDGYAAFAPQGSEEGENYFHGGLLRYDFTKKPAYDALYNLIHKEWSTEIDVTCDTECIFKGFYGTYSANIEVDGQSFVREFKTQPNKENEIVIII